MLIGFQGIFKMHKMHALLNKLQLIWPQTTVQTMALLSNYSIKNVTFFALLHTANHSKISIFLPSIYIFFRSHFMYYSKDL